MLPLTHTRPFYYFCLLFSLSINNLSISQLKWIMKIVNSLFEVCFESLNVLLTCIVFMWLFPVLRWVCWLCNFHVYFSLVERVLFFFNSFCKYIFFLLLYTHSQVEQALCSYEIYYRWMLCQSYNPRSNRKEQSI